MNCRKRLVNSLALHCAACLVFASLVAAADEGQRNDKLVSGTVNLIRAGKLDAALALVRDAEKAASDEVPAALFVLSQAHFRNEQFEESLRILSEITDRHQKSSVASIAWLGKGEVYARLGDEKQMVECLERGIAAPPVETRIDIMDASDTRSRASEILGGHYLKTGQWDKSLKVFSDWKPNSWCGTCLDAMEVHRLDSMLLSLIQLGRHEEATKLAWRIAGTRGWSSDSANFALVRMYEEAGQLADLESLLPDMAGSNALLQAALAALKGGDELSRIPAAQANAARMSVAINVAQDASVESRLAPFRSKNPERTHILKRLDARVAAWLLIRDRETMDREVITAAANEKYDKSAMLTLLCLMDTSAGREALANVAAKGDVYELQNVCNLIRNQCPNPGPILAEVKANAPDDLRGYVNNRPGEPRPLAYRFFEAWPRPGKDSLPRQLPTLENPAVRK